MVALVVFLLLIGYQWPVSPAHVVRHFEPPPQPWLAGHRGVDLAASPGATVRSAGPGVVVVARVIVDRGVVVVAHSGGLRTTYEPVDAAVSPGDRVAAGDPLGLVTAGALHWGLKRGPAYLDPLTLVGLGRMRLLPLSGSAAR